MSAHFQPMPDARLTAQQQVTSGDASTLLDAWYGDQGMTGGLPTARAGPVRASLTSGVILDGHYRIDTPLGVGGFATVYSAWDMRMRRWVAVKVYPESAGVIPLDEAHLQGAVQHPNLMPLYDSFLDPLAGVSGLVMPLYPGSDLQALLDAYGPLSFRMALTCLDQLCGAVEYLWLRRQLVHGDIKPGNVWLTGSGAALLMDFNTPGQLARNPALSMGTPGYTAPEVFRGQGDARSDVFSLGCVLYTCLAGVPPYADDAEASAGRCLPITRHRPDVRPQLAAAIQQAIAPSPNSRFATTREFRGALRGPRAHTPSRILGICWDVLAVVAHLLWHTVRGGWRACSRALYHAMRRPKQAGIEAIMLAMIGWIAWRYATLLWLPYRGWIITGLCIILTLVILRMLGLRRRWW